MSEELTPKDKARQLYTKCSDLVQYNDLGNTYCFDNFNIECAKLIVNTILTETGCGNCKDIDSNYWKEVLHHLELMKENN